MTLLDRVLLARADEQMATLDLAAEGFRHDPWAIRPTQYEGRRRRKPSRRCWQCGRKASHGGYCFSHWKRAANGSAVDSDHYPTFREQARMTRILSRLDSRRMPRAAPETGGRGA